jgi:hypothetical protein
MLPVVSEEDIPVLDSMGVDKASDRATAIWVKRARVEKEREG